MAYKVYMHTNKKNGKKYIGITGQESVRRRWKNGKGYSKCPVFYNAIKKYGWDGFEHEVLFDGLSKEEAEAKEIELISLYKSNNNKFGYNVENGGRVSKMSEAQKEHLRTINTGKKHTEETKKKMSASHIGKSATWLVGIKASEERKAQLSAANKGTKNPRAKSVYQYDLQGNFVAKYEYMEEAKKALNLSSTSHISKCCNGERNKAHGFMWSYSLENKKPYERMWKGGVIHA